MSEVDRSKIHPKLVALVEAVERKTRCKLLCGHRTKEEQEKAFIAKTTKVQFPKSRHNSLPSEAIDLIPLPVKWDDVGGFKIFCKLVCETAKELEIDITSMGLEHGWDYPHFSLKSDKTKVI